MRQYTISCRMAGRKGEEQRQMMSGDGSEKTEKAKEQVIRAGLELVKSGLIARTWGNISARISETQFVITPSGRAYDTLTPADIVTVNIADCSYEGNIRPSSEKGVHAAAYRQRKEVGFVIHTHQNYATDLSTLGRTLKTGEVPAGTEDVREALEILGPEIPTAGYGLSGTKQLTDFVEQAIADHPSDRAVLMRNHGALCMGRDYDSAFRIAHELEKVCREKYLDLVGIIAPEEMDETYSLSKYCHVFHREIPEEAAKRSELFAAGEGIGCVIETDAPYIHEYSTYGTPLVPYVDDLAQIVGMDIPILPEDASRAQAADVLRKPGTSAEEVNHAVLIRNRGALCTAANEKDAEAVVMILDKGCQMGLLEKAGEGPIPVSREDGETEHRAYVESYSKLAVTNRG